MKIVALSVVVAAVIAGYIFKQSSQAADKPKWHEGPGWERLFAIYDKLAKEQFEPLGCLSQLVPSDKFGLTQIHACGNSSNPPVILLHGMASSSLIWGDWLMESLSKQFYTVAVDTCGDTGRTFPLHGDPTNCPETRDEVAEWLVQIGTHLNTSKPMSLVGYSYGSFLASEAALSRQSSQFDNLVLMAPAAVVAPIEQAWVLRIVALSLAQALLPTESLVKQVRTWFFEYMKADPNVSLKDMRQEYKELRQASDEATVPHITLEPKSLNDSTLEEMARNHPTLLVIGEGETVTNATLATERAKKAGIQVQLYKDSGHLLLMEHPREHAVGVVTHFLTDEA